MADVTTASPPSSFEVIFTNEDGKTLCSGRGETRGEARKAAVTHAFRRLDSQSEVSQPGLTGANDVSTQVFVVNSTGSIISSGEGSSHSEAYEDAFVTALGRLHIASTAVISFTESAETPSLPEQSSTQGDTAPVVVGVIDGPVKRWPEVAVRKFTTYACPLGPTTYSVIGPDGSGKLTLCLNLIARMSHRYDKVLVFTDKNGAGTAKHFCGLRTTNEASDVSALIAEPTDHPLLRHALVIDGVSARIEGEGSLSGLLASAFSNGVDVFFCAKSRDQLAAYNYWSDVQFFTQGLPVEIFLSLYMMQSVRRFIDGHHLFSTYQEIASSVGRAMGFIRNEQSTWSLEYLPWSEIDALPKRLLA